MWEAVSRSRRATPESLADYLYERDAKDVCEALGISSKGRRKAIVQRLLQWPDNSASDGAAKATVRKETTKTATTKQERSKPVAKKKRSKRTNGNGANLGFERTLWLAADKLRNNMDVAEGRYIALGSSSSNTSPTPS